MKNFFEFFGFLSMACVSAVLIFIFIGGNKGGLKNPAADGFLGEMSAPNEVPNAPKTISDHPLRSKSAASASRDKSVRPQESTVSEISAEKRLKSLYNDDEHVEAAIKQWKGLVKDAAEEYSLKPQVLLAHVVVQTYLGDYSRSQLYNDAASHAGERLKPVSAALKNYRYGWTMQKLIDEFNLAKHFPAASATPATAAVSFPSTSKSAAKGVDSKASPKYVAPISKTNPVEEGFKNVVAKEYGFTSWAGLQKLADPDTKNEATRRVKSLMMAARVR